MREFVVLSIAISAQSIAFAGEADVIAVEVSCGSDSTCNFDVTVRHDDDGWEHYANRWEVRSPDGKQLAVRELLHPHDTEQPFTRSLHDVKIPGHINEVIVRARDSQHRYGGQEIRIRLER